MRRYTSIAAILLLLLVSVAAARADVTAAVTWNTDTGEPYVERYRSWPWQPYYVIVHSNHSVAVSGLTPRAIFETCAIRAEYTYADAALQPCGVEGRLVSWSSAFGAWQGDTWSASLVPWDCGAPGQPPLFCGTTWSPQYDEQQSRALAPSEAVHCSTKYTIDVSIIDQSTMSVILQLTWSHTLPAGWPGVW